MKSISKGIVAVLTVLCVILVNTVVPANAYAESLSQVGAGATHSVSTVVNGNANNITVNNSSNTEGYSSQDLEGKYRWVQPLVEGLAEGTVKTIGYAAGAVVACYAADAAATTFFPPAAVLASVCPSVAGAFSLKEGVEKGVKKATTKGLQKVAIKTIVGRAY